MTASACVRGRNRAIHVRPTGMAVIGTRAPARNQGAIAIAEMRACIPVLGGPVPRGLLVFGNLLVALAITPSRS
jgi:hypothetical protein